MIDKKKEFWEKTSKLIDVYRDKNDERASQGVVSCRILFSKIFNN